MKRENMKTNIKTISENISVKPSKTSRVFNPKCIIWSFGFGFVSCLMFGIVLFLYHKALQQKVVESEKNSSIEKDPVLNTGNGRMVNVNRSKIPLNTSDSDLPLVIRPTVVRPSVRTTITTTITGTSTRLIATPTKTTTTITSTTTDPTTTTNSTAEMMTTKPTITTAVIPTESTSEPEKIDCEWSVNGTECSSTCGVGIQLWKHCKTKMENEHGYCTKRGGNVGSCFVLEEECNLRPCPDGTNTGNCPEFALNSYGIARQYFSAIMGDYLLQSVRNNGRNVYRTKEVVSAYNQTGFIYLYSFDAEQYAENDDYEELKDLAGKWMFSYRVNTIYIIMLNSKCGITDHPFGRECDKNWYVHDRDSNTLTNDQSITLECKDKGYCINEDFQCEYWASVGECENEAHSSYMLIKCKKACKVCETTIVLPAANTTIRAASWNATTNTTTMITRKNHTGMKMMTISTAMMTTTGPIVTTFDEIAHNACTEVTLNSNGSARQLHPEIMVDYLLLSVKNNGRVVYRSKEMVFKYQMHSYVYIYSFDAEEYVYMDGLNKDEHSESIARLQNYWMISGYVNGIGYVMVNFHCRTRDLPFSNDCDKSWITFKEDDMPWINDQSVTFVCKKEKI